MEFYRSHPVTHRFLAVVTRCTEKTPRLLHHSAHLRLLQYGESLCNFISGLIYLFLFDASFTAGWQDKLGVLQDT